MGNPYKQAPFTLRFLLIVVVVSAIPIIEVYRKSSQMRRQLQSKFSELAIEERKRVDLRGNYDQLRKLRRNVEELQQKLSVYGSGSSGEFQISDLIRSAADISAQRGVIVDYIQAKDLTQPAGTPDHQDVDIGLVGQFSPVVQFMQQLLKSQRRVSIVDVDVFGNDPLQRYLDLSDERTMPDAKELQQLSSVRVKATLRIVHKF